MTQTAEEKLGVRAFGAPGVAGNFLTHPRYVVLGLLQRAFQIPDLFVPEGAESDPEDANPFILELTDEGEITADSAIVITDQFSEEQLQKDNRPRIVVDRGSGNFQNRTELGARQTGSFVGARESYSDMFDTTLVVRCISRVKLESEQLGLVATAVIQFLRKELRKQGGLFHVEPPSVGPASPLRIDSEADHFDTQITSRLVQTVNWNKTQLNVGRLFEVCFTVED